MDFNQTKKLFWISLAGTLIAFWAPFVDSMTGIEAYMEILPRTLFSQRRMDFQMWIISFLLICTLLWVPLMGYSFRKYTKKKQHYTTKQRSINIFLFSVGSSVYLLPLYAIIDGEDITRIFKWGYWLLLICMTIMFYCYLKMQKERIIDDGDMTQHLIDDEN